MTTGTNPRKHGPWMPRDTVSLQEAYLVMWSEINLRKTVQVDMLCDSIHGNHLTTHIIGAEEVMLKWRVNYSFTCMTHLESA